MATNNADKGEKLYSCQLCQKTFKISGYLKDHLRAHTGEKPFKCQICLKLFSQMCHLKSHMRSHTGEKPFICQLCQKSFATSSNLNDHLRTHTGDKPHICQLCKKSFSLGRDLKRHMLIHTGEKPYKCQICGTSFNRGSVLNRHSRTHASEKPNKCQLCHKSYINKVSLTRHMRAHSGENPYMCQLCQEKFPSGSEVQRHMKTHAAEKAYDKGIDELENMTIHRSTSATEEQHAGNNFYIKSSSSSRPFEFDVVTQQHNLQMGSEVVADLSQQFTSFSNTNDSHKPNELFSKNLEKNGLEGILPITRISECLLICKFKSTVDENAHLYKSFGCGLCSDLFELEQDFLEHCSSHRFSPPDELCSDLF